MAKQLIKGNEAVVKGAILAGCRSFFGYPITPASEIAEAAAKYMPLVGATFVQAESEIASIQMVFGASAAGDRTMTASSGPGMSLKQEGISYAACCELPMVVVDVMRGGPGLGNIAPEQSDYNQMVKGGGHGNYKLLVLAPNSVQEMCDFTMLAFELADKWRIPVIVLTDGLIGQMMESVNFPDPVRKIPDKDWAVKGTLETRDNLINSIILDPALLEKQNIHLQEKYSQITAHEIRYDEIMMDDADVVLVAYGIVSRLFESVIDMARADGHKVGLFRPKTLWPFPSEALNKIADKTTFFMCSEMSNGQMVEDVRLAINGKCPVYFYGRMGGMVPTSEELYQELQRYLEE